MAMYRVATVPLVDLLEDQILTHKWHADDGNVASRIESLRIVVDNSMNMVVNLVII